MGMSWDGKQKAGTHVEACDCHQCRVRRAADASPEWWNIELTWVEVGIIVVLVWTFACLFYWAVGA